MPEISLFENLTFGPSDGLGPSGRGDSESKGVSDVTHKLDGNFTGKMKNFVVVPLFFAYSC